MDLQSTGADSFRQLARDLKGFESKKEILKELRAEIRKPVPTIRAAVRAAAVRFLPSRNGLGAWVARTRINASVRVSGSRWAGVSLRGTKPKSGGKSDIKRIDEGSVRAPTFGRKGKGDWHTQSVTPGFYTKTITEEHRDDWQAAIESAVVKAVSRLG